MKYVALIRGINVGGNSMISMLQLKAGFEKVGFIHVSTYIHSGNVLFETTLRNMREIEQIIEKMIENTFSIRTNVMTRTATDIRRVLAELPRKWQSEDFRCYIAFIKSPMTPHTIVGSIAPKDGVDVVRTGHGVVYLITKRSDITKSGFTKFVGSKIYQYMTIRNLNTVKKLDERLMAYRKY